MHFQPDNNFTKGESMNRHFIVMAAVLVMFCAGIAGAQEYPILDKIAEKVIAKYQQSSCEQLW
jgi:hypothetical protein